MVKKNPDVLHVVVLVCVNTNADVRDAQNAAGVKLVNTISGGPIASNVLTHKQF